MNFKSQHTPNKIFWGSAPDLTVAAYSAPQTTGWWGGAHFPPNPSPHSAFWVSSISHSASPHFIPWCRLCSDRL